MVNNLGIYLDNLITLSQIFVLKHYKDLPVTELYFIGDFIFVTVFSYMEYFRNLVKGQVMIMFVTL